jgi:hypothetical protein
MVNLFRYLLLVLKKYRALSHEQSSVSPETRRSSVDSVGETERVAKKCVPINNSSRRIVGYCSVCSRPLKSKRDPTKGLLHLTCKCGHETNIGTEVSSKKHRKKRPAVATDSSLSRMGKEKDKCPGCGLDLNKLCLLRSAVYRGIKCPICGTDVSSRMNIVDFRSEGEKRIELRAQHDLGGEDERLAKRLLQLQRGRESAEAKAEIRRIGKILGASGGSDRMARVAYRVEYLGGSSRQLEYAWAGICGWRP